MRDEVQRWLAMVWRPAATGRGYYCNLTDRELEDLVRLRDIDMDYPKCGDKDCATCTDCDAPPF